MPAHSDHSTIKPSVQFTWTKKLLRFVAGLAIVLSSVWVAMALWYQQPLGTLATLGAIAFWLVLAYITLKHGLTWHVFGYRPNLWLYSFLLILIWVWYSSIEAKQDREWAPDVEKVLSIEQHGDTVTLHHVRNFNWHSEHKYDRRWETRTVNLNHISGVNVITSYWMGPQIAHTLVSFDFTDSPPITFSIEIRKEKNESFSALGGFFKKFELSLVAADEKDIIFTRSNIRKEQVYFFPIRMSQPEARALFEEYIQTAQQLEQRPQWYNTLTSNCTTLVFDMAQAISQHQYPSDYRLILSGYLPNYLYDLHALDHDWSIGKWYQQAHINPKIEGKNNLTSAEYSALIRQGLKSSP